MENILVSIVIPVYNGANYLGEAIDSALAQTYKNIEIIVVNDGSTDDGATEKVALSYGDKIRYFHKENGGVSSALNLGIREMKGEYLSWLSHDDLYTPDKVETQIKDVQKLKADNPEEYKRTMFYCGGGFINSKGEHIERKTRTLPDGFYKGNDMLLKFFKGYGIGGCGLLIPRVMFDEVGYFNEDMRYMQDVFMWEKAFIAGYSIFINNKVMSITRIHNMQTSTTGKAYGLKDRETVGKYLAEHLRGIKSSDGQSVLTQYMFLCMRNNSTNIGKMIYKDLVLHKDITLAEKIKTYLIYAYGFMRKRLSSLYYKVRFGTKR